MREAEQLLRPCIIRRARRQPAGRQAGLAVVQQRISPGRPPLLQAGVPLHGARTWRLRASLRSAENAGDLLAARTLAIVTEMHI